MPGVQTMSKPPQQIIVSLNSHKLRIGFVPLTDCASLVMAEELGLYKIRFSMSAFTANSVGPRFATRSFMVNWMLPMPSGMPFAVTLGLRSVKCDCLTALVLNLHGNAVTLSSQLARKGVMDRASLRT